MPKWKHIADGYVSTDGRWRIQRDTVATRNTVTFRAGHFPPSWHLFDREKLLFRRGNAPRDCKKWAADSEAKGRYQQSMHYGLPLSDRGGEGGGVTDDSTLTDIVSQV